MVILCQACWYKLPGEGRQDQRTNSGTEIIYFLDELVEAIHKERLQGDYSISSGEVDARLATRVNMILAANETFNDWRLHEEDIPVMTIESFGSPLLGAPLVSAARGRCLK